MTKYLPRHLTHRPDHTEHMRTAALATGTAAALPLGTAAVVAAPAIAAESGQGDTSGTGTWKAPLAFNARGPQVRALQERLGLAADGVYGPLTTAAVKRFQQGHGLVVDGIVGPNTWTALR